MEYITFAKGVLHVGKAARHSPISVATADDRLSRIPIQVADVCVSCINWGFRRPGWDMNAQTKSKVEELFAGWIDRLQYKGRRRGGDGREKKMYGIVFVKNPYGSGEP